MGHDKLYRVGNKLLIFITMLSWRMRFQENSIFSSYPAWLTALDDDTDCTAKYIVIEEIDQFSSQQNKRQTKGICSL